MHGISGNKARSVIFCLDFLNCLTLEFVIINLIQVPGQRALALHLLASVLDKAINNIYQKQAGYTSENPHDVDWEGVWAFALGPEPELVLALR